MVQLSDVLRILNQRLVPHQLIELIADIYSDNNIRIENNGEICNQFPINKGIKQAGSLSPTYLTSFWTR